MISKNPTTQRYTVVCDKPPHTGPRRYWPYTANCQSEAEFQEHLKTIGWTTNPINRPNRRRRDFCPEHPLPKITGHLSSL